MELLIPFWILCGIVSAFVASSKGQGGCLWFVIGFVGGPIGVIVAFAWPRNEKALEQRALRKGRAKACPSCAEVVRAEARVCRFCGYVFGD